MWEVYEVKWKEISLEVESGKLKIVKSSEGKNYAARAIVNGKVGFASASSEDEALKKAEKIAKISEDELEDFPVDRPAKVSGLFDKRVEAVTPDYLKEEYEILMNSIEKCNIAFASIKHEVSEVRIRNSLGLDCYEKGSYSSLTLEAVCEGGSAYEMCESRSLDLDIEGTVKKAEDLAIMSSKAEKIESGYYDVVLMPMAVHQLFFYALYPSFSAENVVKGRSMLKKGMEIGNLSIIDDGTIDGGLMSCAFDDEGVASKRTVLVEKGVVKSFYSDWKYGKILGETTGNGFREEESFPPAPSPSNVIIDVEDKADVDGALIVHSLIGSHTSNPVSGDFSLECLNAEIDGNGVKGAMIYGNVFELIKRVEGSCLGVRQVENTVSPAIRFSKVKIV